MKRLSCYLLFGLACAVLGALLSQPAMAQCPVPAPAPPPPVCPEGGLAFATPVAFGWGPPPLGCPAGINDALVGNLGLAWTTKSVGASVIGCLAGEDDAAGPAAAADAALPPVGSGFWYLARDATAAGDFSWNEGPGLPAYDRDILLAGVCP